ncbi:hypothetical protein PMI34_00001, partial [Pseudomonas sp. GM74]
FQSITEKDNDSKASNKMLKRRSFAEWFLRGAVTSCEMQAADEQQFKLYACLVEQAQLGKACRQETT